MFINSLTFFPAFTHSVWNKRVQEAPSLQNPSPFAGIRQLNDLEHLLLSEGWNSMKWNTWKKEIKAILDAYQNDPIALNNFLMTLIKANIHHDPQATFQFFSDVLNLDTLNRLAKFRTEGKCFTYQNPFDWAIRNAPLHSEKIDPSIKDYFYSEWKKCRPTVIYFIPNLINIFLGAFNFLDSHKRFTTLWEKHLLLEIVYKFFIIPFCLVQILQPIFVVTAKVYVIAALIILGGGLLAAAYQRWLKPLPDEIVNCKNLDKEMTRGLIVPKVGQTAELTKLISTLQTGKNVLLVGKSGDGKTALFHQLLQLKKEKKLPLGLQSRSHYEIDCGLLISHVSFGHSELINQIKDQIKGHEKEVTFLLDEFDQLVRNQSAFQAFKRHFLEDHPEHGALFVATTTYKEFEKIQQLDVDGSFIRRVAIIEINKPLDEQGRKDADDQNRLMLDDLVNRIAPTIPVTNDAIDAVVELSHSAEYLPNIGEPAKAKKIMEEVLERSQRVYHSEYISLALDKGRQELKQFQARIARTSINTDENLQTYQALCERIHVLEQEDRVIKQKINQIKQVVQRQLTFKNHHYKLEHQLAAARKNEEANQPSSIAKPISVEAQKLYLLYYFYGVEAFKEVLETELAKVESTIPVKVDGNFVRQVFEEVKTVSQRVFERNSPQQQLPVAVANV